MPLINFSGLASGIDSESLIKATTDAKRLVDVTPRQDKVTDLLAANDALTELKAKLQAVKDSVDVMRTLKGGGLSKLANSSDETVVTAEANSQAQNVSFSVTVNALAQPGSVSFDDSDITSISSPIVPALVGSETIVVTLGSGTGNTETITIPVTNTSTLDSIQAYYNSHTSNRGIASIVNVAAPSATPEYRIIFSSLQEGTAKGTTSVTVGVGIKGLGRFSDANKTSITATDSSIDITGLSTPSHIIRSSNTISDVIDGVTLKLSAVSGTTPPTVSVSDDTAGTTATLQGFVDAFNDLVLFLAENNITERDGTDSNAKFIFGPLKGSSLDENSVTRIREDILASVADSGTEIKTFADLGLSTERDGTLAFDSDGNQFSTGLVKSISLESNSVRSLFQLLGDALATTSGTIDQFIRFQGLVDSAITNNKNQIDRLNDSISRAEAAISKQEASMRAQFSSLEALVGRLQSQQNALTSALAGL